MIMIEPKKRRNYYNELVKELATKGVPSAMMEVCGRFFDSGNYENVKQVIGYLETLSEKGVSHAMLWLGNIYYTGKGVEQSYKEAAKWYEMAADNLESYGLCNLGYCYFYGVIWMLIIRGLMSASRWRLICAIPMPCINSAICIIMVIM